MSRKEETSTAKEKRMQRERTQRRMAIINVAEEFFTRLGYDQTMVDKIAEEVGYTKANIYNYFPSKDDLFMAVGSRAFENLGKVLKEEMKQPDEGFELRALGDAYLAFVDRYPAYAEIMDSGQLSAAFSGIIRKEKAGQSMTESERELRQHQLRIEKLMTEIITQTLKKSGIQGKVNPFAVVYAMSSLGLAIRELVMRGKRGELPEKETREYLSVLLNIIDQGLKHYDAK
jgi:AcrR family transcriptional regulator